MLFFRILQHLLPDGLAWRSTTQKQLRSLLEGLSEEPANIRAAFDLVYEDRFPATTRALAEWEREFGLTSSGAESERRQQLAAAWQAQGGQSPRYLEDTVRAAGFDVYLHEWWEPGTTPREVRNPHDHTMLPLIGTVQCTPVELDGPLCTPQFLDDAPQPQCNRWLVNEPGYLVNLNLTPVAPPPIPDDSAIYPYFLYWCGETFGDVAEVPATRRAEFERMLLKICPAHLWLVTIVHYT
jgi:hypothetical protein